MSGGDYGISGLSATKHLESILHSHQLRLTKLWNRRDIFESKVDFDLDALLDSLVKCQSMLDADSHSVESGHDFFNLDAIRVFAILMMIATKNNFMRTELKGDEEIDTPSVQRIHLKAAYEIARLSLMTLRRLLANDSVLHSGTGEDTKNNNNARFNMAEVDKWAQGLVEIVIVIADCLTEQFVVHALEETSTAGQILNIIISFCEVAVDIASECVTRWENKKKCFSLMMAHGSQSNKGNNNQIVRKSMLETLWCFESVQAKAKATVSTYTTKLRHFIETACFNEEAVQELVRISDFAHKLKPETVAKTGFERFYLQMYIPLEPTWHFDPLCRMEVPTNFIASFANFRHNKVCLSLSGCMQSLLTDVLHNCRSIEDGEQRYDQKKIFRCVQLCEGLLVATGGTGSYAGISKLDNYFRCNEVLAQVASISAVLTEYDASQRVFTIYESMWTALVSSVDKLSHQQDMENGNDKEEEDVDYGDTDAVYMIHIMLLERMSLLLHVHHRLVLPDDSEPLVLEQAHQMPIHSTLLTVCRFLFAPRGLHDRSSNDGDNEKCAYLRRQMDLSRQDLATAVIRVYQDLGRIDVLSHHIYQVGLELGSEPSGYVHAKGFDLMSTPIVDAAIASAFQELSQTQSSNLWSLLLQEWSSMDTSRTNSEISPHQMACAWKPLAKLLCRLSQSSLWHPSAKRKISKQATIPVLLVLNQLKAGDVALQSVWPLLQSTSATSTPTTSGKKKRKAATVVALPAEAWNVVHSVMLLQVALLKILTQQLARVSTAELSQDNDNRGVWKEGRAFIIHTLIPHLQSVADLSTSAVALPDTLQAEDMEVARYIALFDAHHFVQVTTLQLATISELASLSAPVDIQEADQSSMEIDVALDGSKERSVIITASNVTMQRYASYLRQMQSAGQTFTKAPSLLLQYADVFQSLATGEKHHNGADVDLMVWKQVLQLECDVVGLGLTEYRDTEVSDVRDDMYGALLRCTVYVGDELWVVYVDRCLQVAERAFDIQSYSGEGSSAKKRKKKGSVDKQTTQTLSKVGNLDLSTALSVLCRLRSLLERQDAVLFQVMRSASTLVRVKTIMQKVVQYLSTAATESCLEDWCRLNSGASSNRDINNTVFSSGEKEGERRSRRRSTSGSEDISSTVSCSIDTETIGLMLCVLSASIDIYVYTCMYNADVALDESMTALLHSPSLLRALVLSHPDTTVSTAQQHICSSLLELPSKYSNQEQQQDTRTFDALCCVLSEWLQVAISGAATGAVNITHLRPLWQRMRLGTVATDAQVERCQQMLQCIAAKHGAVSELSYANAVMVRTVEIYAHMWWCSCVPLHSQNVDVNGYIREHLSSLLSCSSDGMMAGVLDIITGALRWIAQVQEPELEVDNIMLLHTSLLNHLCNNHIEEPYYSEDIRASTSHTLVQLLHLVGRAIKNIKGSTINLRETWVKTARDTNLIEVVVDLSRASSEAIFNRLRSKRYTVDKTFMTDLAQVQELIVLGGHKVGAYLVSDVQVTRVLRELVYLGKEHLLLLECSLSVKGLASASNSAVVASCVSQALHYVSSLSISYLGSHLQDSNDEQLHLVFNVAETAVSILSELVRHINNDILKFLFSAFASQVLTLSEDIVHIFSSANTASARLHASCSNEATVSAGGKKVLVLMRRLYTAISQSQHFKRSCHTLSASLIQILAADVHLSKQLSSAEVNESALDDSPTAPTTRDLYLSHRQTARHVLLPGLLALMDCCGGFGSKSTVVTLLDEEGLAYYGEVISIYNSSFKYRGT